jgi:PmbA protein
VSPSQYEQIKDRIDKILTKLAKKTEAEVVLEEGESISIDMRQSDVENASQRSETGVGLRLWHSSGRGSFVATNDISEKGLAKARQQAEMALEFAEPDLHIRFYRPEDGEAQGDMTQSYDEQIARLPGVQLIEMAKQIEAKALAYDGRIKNFEKTRVGKSRHSFYLRNSLGLAKEYHSSIVSGFCRPMAEQGGVKEIGHCFDFAREYRSFDYEALAIEAARRAVDKLGASSAATGRYPIVLQREAAADLLQALLSPLYGELVYRKKSLFAGALGEAIASPKVSLINDPLHPQGASRVGMDDEGVPAHSTTLIHEGKLVSYLHNLYSAHALEMSPTASAGRGYNSQPGIAPSNCYLKPEEVSAEDLLAQVDRGIFVQDFMGLHTIDAVSGDFSIGMSGRMIDKGSLGQPVSGLALAGNIRDLLQSIQTVANDIKFFLNGMGGSTVLLKELSVSGEG